QSPISNLQSLNLSISQSLPLISVPNSRLALAHLCSAFYDNPSRKLRVIGVTGTDGKTTTGALVASILRAAGHRVGAITTVGAQIGDQEIDTGFHTTTPDAPEIQRYLAQMVAAEMQYAVIECTSHGLAQHRLAAIDFDIAVVTNIQHEHLDYHKTFENYRAAKAMLFRSLASSHRKARTAKVAVLNAEDTGSFEFLRGIETEEKIIYSTGGTRHVTRHTSHVTGISAHHITHSPSGLSFIVETPHGNLSISSSLLGRYNVSNILAAIGVGIARRVPFEAMREGIANVRGVVGRMQVMQSEPFTAIVDFAHTPNALRVALETAREIARGKVIVVFGCAGLRDAQKRALMGEIAGKLADKIVVTAEDPRTESLDAINAQIAQGLERAGRKNREDYFAVNDRAEAIGFAAQMARAGDVLIVTGKGHERSMCFGETEYPWSDQEALIAALKNQK
ncbi:MAG: UDP-N-acetylmuramoyl-L-alanyl-D-glutamate--2,6-diaminopimelate ligase, partial [Chloroflexi bacterium]|nr:UDP-N-acetylmuramoyl-L-alanyl-D-glutamate--2,6-diaminopimelate ligase [Chloroflexota bacterium]